MIAETAPAFCRHYMHDDSQNTLRASWGITNGPRFYHAAGLDANYPLAYTCIDFRADVPLLRIEPSRDRLGGFLLLLQFFFKLGKLLQRNLVFLIQHLMYSTNFFDLHCVTMSAEPFSVSRLYLLEWNNYSGRTYIMHQHALDAILERHRA